jgi:elongation factor Ts
LLELNCESDFVARTDDFQNLMHDICMQVAAADPRYIRREDVPAAEIAKESEIARDRARQEGKPEKILDKIVEGRLAKYYEEVCLLEQPFIKDNTLTVNQLISSVIGKLGENITVARFERMKVGETAKVEATRDEQAAG